MKFTPQIAALDLLEDWQKSNQKDKVVKSFWQRLIKKKQTKNLAKILLALDKIHCQKNQIVSLQVESARPLSPDTESNLKQWLKQLYPHQKLEINYQIDPKIIGGLKIIGFDRTWDLTIKNQLQSLSKQIC